MSGSTHIFAVAILGMNKKGSDTTFNMGVYTFVRQKPEDAVAEAKKCYNNEHPFNHIIDWNIKRHRKEKSR